MRLIAAVVPPREAQEDLAAVVRSVPGEIGQLDLLAADALVLPVANFGNVARADLETLGEVLSRMAASSPSFVLRLNGGAALENPGEHFVSARVTGELDRLSRLVHGIPPEARRLGFLLDRRAFRPQVHVGEVTSVTTLEYLQAMLARLDEYEGHPWRTRELSLLHPNSPQGGRPTYDEVVRYALAESGLSATESGAVRPW